MPDKKVNKIQERERRIKEVATSFFLENGLRGTTMQMIAARAGIAKPTLYTHYSDKEAVFQAIISDLIARMKTTMQEKLKDDGSLADRIGRAIAAKYQLVTTMIARSPHAQELMTDKHLYAGQEFAELKVWLIEEVERALLQAGIPEARWLATLIIACADGIYSLGGESEDLAGQMVFVTRRLLGQDK